MRIVSETPEPIPFDIADYTHEQQMAMLVMRFNDPLARAVLLRLHRSTVAGKDFDGLKQKGLAVWNSVKQLHDFTPRGRWVSTQVTRTLAEIFDVVVVQQRVITAADRKRYERGRLNWANR